MKILSNLIIMAVISFCALATEALTLNEAVDIAMKESPAIKASRYKTEAAKAGIQSANAAFMPQLNASQTYLRSDDPVIVFGGKLQQGKFTQADFDLSSLNKPSGINNWITRVELKQPVFNSGISFANKRGAEAAHQAQRHMEAFDRSRTTYAIAQLYYSSVALERQQAAINDGIRKLKALESSYQLIEAPTSASTTSYLVAKSVRTNLEAEAKKLECHKKQMARDLNAVMGRAPETPIKFEDPLPQVNKLKQAEAGSSARGDVLAVQSQAEAARAARDAAVRRWGPDVDFFSAYNIYTGDFKSAEGSYEVGARLSLPLFNWNTYASAKKTEAELNAARHAQHASELSAEADFQTAMSNLESCIKRYYTVKDAASIAAEALNIADQRYNEGTLPLMDYSQTIQNWVQMQVEFIDNHLKAALARANLDFQIGGNDQ